MLAQMADDVEAVTIAVEGRHDPWPYINYVLSILRMAYREFAERVSRRTPAEASPGSVASGMMIHAAR